MSREYPITPMGAPRMTRADAWKKRPAVLKYREFKDRCRESFMFLPKEGGCITFVMPMPKSWPEKKKREMNGGPHQQKPDIDNLLKAVMDAVYEDDSVVWDIRARKVWGRDGGIKIWEGEQWEWRK